MKFTTKKITYSPEIRSCQNCGHSYKGKVCNICGEKVFEEKQLTSKHFLHEVVDFFYHFESKVLKTIKLNIFKPGFVTKENLRGVRVPYARPVQLYLVVAFAFYLIVGKLGISDYIPTHEDHNYFLISDYKLLKWTKPFDTWVVNGIDTMWQKKGDEIKNEIQHFNEGKAGNNVQLQLTLGENQLDSISIPYNKIPILSYRQMTMVRQQLFKHSIGTLAKTLIFLLIPIFAGFFYLIFYKKLKYYGSALILATHFLIFNLCFYSIMCLVNELPKYIHKNLGYLFSKGMNVILYNNYTEPFVSFVFGPRFEMYHLIFWMPWLFIAFKRLFNTPWWKNLLLSYVCSRLFFYLIFGVFKKALIAFTIWNLHL